MKIAINSGMDENFHFSFNYFNPILMGDLCPSRPFVLRNRRVVVYDSFLKRTYILRVALNFPCSHLLNDCIFLQPGPHDAGDHCVRLEPVHTDLEAWPEYGHRTSNRCVRTRLSGKWTCVTLETACPRLAKEAKYLVGFNWSNILTSPFDSINETILFSHVSP